VAPVALRTDIMILEDAIDVLAALVLGQALDKLAVDADGPRNNRHDVLSESAGLVRADDAGVGHRLARAENMNEQTLLGHALSSERKSKSNGKREICIEQLARRHNADLVKHTFRDSNDDRSDGNDQNLDNCHGLDTRGTVHLGSDIRTSP
jgi:hypothetical protein